jgi:hypothetical protein
MSDDDYEDDETDPDEEFDGELDDDELVDDELVVDEEDALDEGLVEGAVEDLVTTDVDADDEDDEAKPAAVKTEEDEEIIDLDEELHPDDVEEALDVVLRERTAKARLEDDEEDDEPDERGEAGNRIVPRRPGEFVCSSCFLVLPRHMLADEGRQLCSDCV